MKNKIITTLIIFNLLFSATIQINAEIISFSDVPSDHTFYSYITELNEKEIISGYENGTFKPDQELTRGQLAKFVVKGFDLKSVSKYEKFDDVPKDFTFYEEIHILRTLDIINGYDDNTFRPDEIVTRGVAMKFIMKAASYKTNNFSQQNKIQIFSDVETDNTFFEYINSAASYILNNESRIITGYSDGNFGVNDPINRGAMSKVLSQILKLIDEGGEFSPPTGTVKGISTETPSESKKIDETISEKTMVEQLEEYLFELINDSRAEYNVEELGRDTKADIVARNYSEHMADIDELVHNPNLAEDLTNEGIDWTGYGENIGYYSFSYQPTLNNYKVGVKAIHDGMMAEVPPEDGHLRNILGTDIDFEKVGVGIAIEEDGMNTVWITEDFTRY